MPRGLDPGGGAPPRPHCKELSVAFRLNTPSTTAMDISWLDPAAYILAVYASQMELPTHPRKTRYRVRWPSFPDGLAYQSLPLDTFVDFLGVYFTFPPFYSTRPSPGARRVSPGCCLPGDPSDPSMHD